MCPGVISLPIPWAIQFVDMGGVYLGDELSKWNVMCYVHAKRNNVTHWWGLVLNVAWLWHHSRWIYKRGKRLPPIQHPLKSSGSWTDICFPGTIFSKAIYGPIFTSEVCLDFLHTYFETPLTLSQCSIISQIIYTTLPIHFVHLQCPISDEEKLAPFNANFFFLS